MTLKVHMTYEYPPEVIQHLRDQLDRSVQFTFGKQAESDGDFHILVDGRPSPEMIQEKKNLHTIIVPWTGIPPETRTLLLDNPHITLHNLHHNAIPVAEMAFTLLLAAAKKTVPVDQALRKGDWTMRYQKPPPARLLYGKTALILGYGVIGRHVAQYCRALGMHVLALKRTVQSVEADQIANEIHPGENLRELLPRADVLIITLPLTTATEGLIGHRELSLLPPGSVLVNVGRALIVDEKALYTALRDHKLGAAGLDVWYNYPSDEESRTDTTPAEYPFWELDNVVLSPHCAGHVLEIDLMRMSDLAILLNAAAQNKEMPNKVDLRKGY